MEIRWIEYKSKKILHLDYRGAKNEHEMIELLEKGNEYIKNSGRKILVLVDYAHTYATQTYMDKLKENGKQNAPFIEKTAVLGVEGIKKILMNTYVLFTGEKNIKLFENEDKAKEWLVS